MAPSPLDVVLRLTATVGTAQTLQEIYDAALDGLHETFGVDRASILLFDPDGVMRFKAWRGLSPEYRAALEGHTPWTAGQAAPDPIVTDVRTDPSLAGYAGAFARERVAALVFVPLVAEGRVIGKFTLYDERPAAFDRDQIRLAATVGVLLGFAVERTRRATDAQLARQRMLFALDSASMGTWEWDPVAGTVRWSENLERIHGLPPGTFTGGFESYAREIHPADRERVMASLQRALDEDLPHEVEYRIVAPDGTVRWVLGKGRVERDEARRPLRMSGICMDISERKRIEAENARLFDDSQRLLRDEAALRERLTTLTDGSLALLTSLSSESVVSEVLALAARLLPADAYAVWRRDGDDWHTAGSRGLSAGFTAERVKGDGRFVFERPIVASDLAAQPLLSERAAAYASEGIASLLSVPLLVRGEPGGSIVFYYRARHEPSEAELRVAVALGHLSAAAISNAELYDEQRALRARAEAAQARTAFLAEASARLSSLDYEENLRVIAQLAVPHVCDWCTVDLRDEAGSLKRLATAHVDPLKVRFAEELHDRYPADLSEPRGAGQVLRTGQPELYPEISDDLLVRAAVNAEHLEMLRELGLRSAMVVPLAAGTRIFGVMSLVSASTGRSYDRADLEFAVELGRRAAFAMENARLYREVQNANRLKDEFLATLSHELRTPLNVILGRVGMLAGAPDLEAAHRMGEVIDRNARTLARLVEDLLDVSRMTVGRITLDRQHLRLPPILDSAAQAVQSAVEAKGLTLRVETGGNIPAVLGDATRIQQIIWNLLTNAVKFTPAGGVIDVRLAASDGHVVLAVRDTGEGIAAEALPHVFDMFWQSEPTASRRHGGLGLGLSIVRKLVELHGGYVRAESGGLGQGTTFTITLPSGPAGAVA